ncbi:MAG: DM13 domain-containing protein, partial [Gammaproteobacteria bacterium]|nr:DM13 domain-containing protein [Gammaproteobacteria bacterium]
MKKTALLMGLALIVGIAIGAFGMLIAFPYLFPPAEVNESVQDVDSKSAIAKGEFIHPDPSDPVHWGRGHVTVFAQGNHHELYLEPDFEVGPGPDYYVYLSSGTDIRSNEDFEAASNISIGRLKSFRGSQVYPVDDNVGIEQMASVV